MSRAAYIGGFGEGEASVNRVADAIALERNITEVIRFTLANAINNPKAVDTAVKWLPVLTHSGGAIVLPGTRPESIEAYGAPLPNSKLRLVGRTIIKTARMHFPGIGIKSWRDVAAVTGYDIDSQAEILDYLKRGVLGEYFSRIADFNAISSAAGAVAKDIPATLDYTTSDEYFKPTEMQKSEAKYGGVRLLEAPGSHDALVLDPIGTLKAFALAGRTWPNGSS